MRGFTLIELVVVIVLLGILSAIALPRFVDLRGDARKAVNSATLAAFSMALQNAQAKWQATAREGDVAISLKGGVPDTLFSETGLILTATKDQDATTASQLTTNAIGPASATEHEICANIFRNIMSDNSMNVIAQDGSSITNCYLGAQGNPLGETASVCARYVYSSPLSKLGHRCEYFLNYPAATATNWAVIIYLIQPYIGSPPFKNYGPGSIFLQTSSMAEYSPADIW